MEEQSYSSSSPQVSCQAVLGFGLKVVAEDSGDSLSEGPAGYGWLWLAGAFDMLFLLVGTYATAVQYSAIPLPIHYPHPHPHPHNQDILSFFGIIVARPIHLLYILFSIPSNPQSISIHRLHSRACRIFIIHDLRMKEIKDWISDLRTEWEASFLKMGGLQKWMSA